MQADHPTRIAHRRDMYSHTSGSIIAILLITLLLLATTAVLATAEEYTWMEQFGTANPERASGVAAGDNGFFVTGWIDRGSLDQATSVGGADAFVRHYDRDASVVWTRQFGTSSTDRAYAIDTFGDGFVIVGSTAGAFDGFGNAGLFDGFVMRHNAAGDREWVVQFGTSGTDEVTSVAVVGSDIYIAGWTEATLPLGAVNARTTGDDISPVSSATGVDAFLIKVTADGTFAWTRQFGTLGFDKAYAVAAAEDGVYVAGRVGLALTGQTHFGSSDAFVRHYDSDGNEVWTRQFGTTSQDIAFALTSDAGGVYVAGETPAALPGQTSMGRRDVFVKRYALDGTEMWTRQIGGSGDDAAYGIDVDPTGVYLVGSTGAGLDGYGYSAGADAYIVKLDLDGNDIWGELMGSSSLDETAAIDVAFSATYVAGWTLGALPEQDYMGSRDAYVARYGVPDIPAPNVAQMTLDIQPGECPKTINLEWLKNRDNGNGDKTHMGGVLPVAVAAGPGGDVGAIDPSSCLLEGVAPLRWSYEDVTSPRSDGDCECDDAGPDGVLDLTLKFSRQDIIDALMARGLTGEVEAGTLTLTGTLLDGTMVEAHACVNIRGGENAVLGAARPNPFNPVTMIEYSLPAQTYVSLNVYDVSGRLVDRLVGETQAAGVHQVWWNADGSASGVYFYQLRAGRTVATRRVTMLK